METISLISKLLFSVSLGFLIGLEREHQGKAIGIRTVSLITLGSTLYALLSVNIFGGDPARVIAQIVTGISFLGAGLIIKDQGNIHGLTTAACVWVAAAIGALVGVSLFQEAFAGTILIIIINSLFSYIKPDGNTRK